MGQPLQMMKQGEAQPASKEAVKTDKLPLLSLLTFSPMGNPLSSLTPGQRTLFFDYLLISLQNQRREQAERAAALMKRHPAIQAALPAAAISLGMRAQEERGKAAVHFSADAQPSGGAGKAAAGAQSREEIEKEGRHLLALEMVMAGKVSGAGSPGIPGEGAGAPGLRFMQQPRCKSSLLKRPEGRPEGASHPSSGADGRNHAPAILQPQSETHAPESGPGARNPAIHTGEGWKNGMEGPSAQTFTSAFGPKSLEMSNAICQLALVVDDYARGSEAKEKRVVNGLHGKMRADSYQTDDLMASLLLVIEDDAWAGEGGGLGSAKPHGGSAKIAAMVPEKLRYTAQDSAVVRLASVREMLRHYFRLHPKDYHAALAGALGITADQEEDSTFMQERLAAELAHIGGFALAQKMLAEVKLKKKMGTEECLARLGYRYDAKNKRLVLGKRTCGKPVEARGIIGLLLALARK